MTDEEANRRIESRLQNLSAVQVRSMETQYRCLVEYGCYWLQAGTDDKTVSCSMRCLLGNLPQATT